MAHGGKTENALFAEECMGNDWEKRLYDRHMGMKAIGGRRGTVWRGNWETWLGHVREGIMGHARDMVKGLSVSDRPGAGESG